MATKSGQMSYKGQQISIKTLAKDITVEDPNSKFVASNLEDVLVEVLSSTDSSNKVDKVTGMGLSENSYSTAEKTKLAGIQDNANNYTHPATHSATMIVQDSNNRLVTDAQIATWGSGATTSDVSSALTTAKAYTDTNITNLKGSVPINLNTLSKIALAINNDPSYDSNIKAYINSKLTSYSQRGSIDIEQIGDLSAYTVNVGDIINFVTYTTTFYKCTNSGASTFDTKYTQVAALDPASCTPVTDKVAALNLSIANNSYIYIVYLTVTKSYECVTTDPTVTNFNDKYKILLSDGFVESQITALINGAPGTLNTLNELATALGDDANFSTTMTNQLTTINTTITNLSGQLATLTSNTNSSFSTVNTTLTSLQTQITALQNTDAAALDGGTF